MLPAFFGGKSSLKKSGLFVRIFGALGFSTSSSLEEELSPFLSEFVLMNRPSLYLPGFVSMTPTERRNMKSLNRNVVTSQSHLQWGRPLRWLYPAGRPWRASRRTWNSGKSRSSWSQSTSRPWTVETGCLVLMLQNSIAPDTEIFLRRILTHLV